MNGLYNGLSGGLADVNAAGVGHGLAGDDCKKDSILNIPNLMAWYDAKSLNVDYSNKVLQLIDKSGNSRHMTQSATANYWTLRPELGDIKGPETVNAGFSFPYEVDLSNFSLFAVVKKSPSNATFILFEHENNYQIQSINIRGTNTSYLTNWINGPSKGMYVYPSKYMLVEFHAEKGNLKKFFLNGVLNFSDVFGSYTKQTGFTFLGGYYYAETSGQCKEIILFNNRLSDADKLKVRNILNKKHKIY